MKIAIGAGHRHTRNIAGNLVQCGGANCYEFQRNGDVTVAVAQALRAAGYDLRSYTPLLGTGLFEGDYNEAAYSVVQWGVGGWVPDLFIEFHSEGAAPDVRGSFVIYPDNVAGDDVDIDVQKRGHFFAENLRDLTGIPVRGNGTMSETETGVGLEGWRLGVFAATTPLKSTTTRLIFEAGAHSNAQDLALMNKPNYPNQVAAAVLKSIPQLMQSLPPGTPETPDKALNRAVRSLSLGESMSVGQTRVYRVTNPVQLNNRQAYKYADLNSAKLGVLTGAKPLDAIIVNSGTWFLLATGERVPCFG